TSSSDPICLLSLLDDSCQRQQKKVNPSITVVTHSTGLLPRTEHLLISFSPLFTTPSISFLFFPYSHLHLSYNLPYLLLLLLLLPGSCNEIQDQSSGLQICLVEH